MLMVPSVLGMIGTRINYDMLNYLPDSMDTVIGQDELMKDFGKGAFSFIVVENMPDKDVEKVVNKVKKVNHVQTVLWYSSLADISIPKEMLPDELFALLGLVRKGLVNPSTQTANESDKSKKQRRKRYVKAIYTELYFFFRPLLLPLVSLLVSAAACAFSLYRLVC